MSQRVGILGAALIAPTAIIQPARRRSDIAVHAIGARSGERAQAYAAAHEIPISYGSYEEVLEDPDVTLVYNALPPSQHVPWSIAALEAGKHVLCEKPIALNEAEARRLAQASDRSGLQVAEAFHDRYHPLFLYLLELKSTGKLGTITEVDVEVSIQMKFNPDSFRHDPRVGGGALMEFGCYPVRWLRDLVGEEPVVSEASAALNPLGGDARIEASLQFPGGARGRLLADGRSETPGVRSRIIVTGSRGKVMVDNPVSPHTGHSVQEWFDDGYEVRTIGGRASYDYQLDAILAAMRSGVPALTGPADFVSNMRLIDAIYAAAGIDRSAL